MFPSCLHYLDIPNPVLRTRNWGGGVEDTVSIRAFIGEGKVKDLFKTKFHTHLKQYGKLLYFACVDMFVGTV